MEGNMVKIVNYVYWFLVIVTAGKMTLGFQDGWTLALTVFGPMVISYVLGYFTAKQY
jgi:hypothetical protein